MVDTLANYGVLGVLSAILITAIGGLALYIKNSFESERRSWNEDRNKWDSERKELLGIVSELRIELARQSAEIQSLQLQVGKQQGISEVKDLLNDYSDRTLKMIEQYVKGK